MARELKRLNVNMTVELLEQVDDYADKMNINRSAAINLLVSTALEQKNVMGMMDDLLNVINEVRLSKD